LSLRSLIVLSKDYGQLGFALQWLRGQSVAAGTRMLMPQRLYSHNREGLPVPVELYSTAEDLSQAVEEWRPNLVLLFSAYRFANDGVLSREALSTFLDSLQRRGCRIITSDPFLGLAPRLTLGEIDTRMGTAVERRWWRRWPTRLSLALQRPTKTVVNAPDLGFAVHLYPTPVPIHDEVTRLSFFNSSSPVVSASLRGQADPDREQCKHWLFVLSDSDLVCQRQLIGLKTFLQHLMALVRYTADVGRRASVVAPPRIADRLATDLGPAIEVSAFCPFHEFERRLLEAEYAFFWSAFSFSQLVRVANGLPVFLLDRGHFARTVRPFYEHARAWYGWEPPMLDQRQLFSPYVLTHLAKTQVSATRAIRERWRSSPSPDTLVHQLLAIGAAPRSG
jgi:hypothetical protein